MFDRNFEIVVMLLVISVLFLIIGLFIRRNKQVPQVETPRQQTPPKAKQLLSMPVNCEEESHAKDKTAVIPKARVPVATDSSSLHESAVPLLHRLRQRPAPPPPEPKEKTATMKRNQMQKEVIDGFEPTNEAEELLYPDLKKLAKGGEIVHINVREALNGISLKGKRTLRDLLALAGEHDHLVTLLTIDPTLKEPEFCGRMDAMYAHLLDDLKDVRAPETTVFWQRCRDLLSNKANAE